MTRVSRRGFLGMAVAGAVVAAGPKIGRAQPHATGLRSITTGAQPITVEERNARLVKVQSLMRQRKIAALLVESGSTLEYFTGIQWRRSERITAALIPAEGQTVVVTPFFEQPSIRESLQIPADVRPWKEDQNPFALFADALRSHGSLEGPLAVEATTRFFAVDGVAKASGGRSVVPGEQLVRACRMVKSSAELALMQTANDVTMAAIKYVHGQIQGGMRSSDILNLMASATEALGGMHAEALVLLNEASAFPHGSVKPQSVRKGSVILIDAGCTLHGYESDISRSWVFGEPSPHQREIWGLVKRGQELALETAKLGAPVGAIDIAVRTFYEQKGWSKDYGLPGLSHRTGHGIGMDGHEAPYLVRSDTTPLEVGMSFSDEPGIYIPGEFGIRLEDCWYMTGQGPKLFTPLAKSIDQPV